MLPGWSLSPGQLVEIRITTARRPLSFFASEAAAGLPARDNDSRGRQRLSRGESRQASLRLAPFAQFSWRNGKNLVREPLCRVALLARESFIRSVRSACQQDAEGIEVGAQLA